MTARYFVAEDGQNEPTIWEHDPDYPDFPYAVLRRCDLHHAGREGLWAVIVAGLNPDALRAEGWDHCATYTERGKALNEAEGEALRQLNPYRRGGAA